MAYRDFTLEQISKQFALSIEETIDLFATVEPVAVDAVLLNTLKRNVPLAVAINTEKAKSEFIIAPLLLELKTRFPDRVGLFSGVEFNVDPSQGLNGVCDFLISRSPHQVYISTPVIAIVEAKNDNIKSGLAQCIATMVAASRFNEREGQAGWAVYGAVTNGNQWRFLRLREPVVALDMSDYYINDPGKILGILADAIQAEEDVQAGSVN
jgi:hypothetical protein